MIPLPRQRLALLMVVLLSLGIGRSTSAATLPAGFSETQVASGLQSITAMTIAPDGRVFVCEQVGRLRVIKNDVLLATPFLTVSVNSSGERGLLGVAFDPNFASNRFIYIYYTTSAAPIHNRISRFTASATNPDVVQAGTEVQLMNLPNLSATNHNGGAMHFGPDGKLYVAVGENAVSSNAPSLNTPLGKMLRINSDGTIPTDNPFFGQTTGNARAIWARGLRNPFTFAFQPGTGRMHINDVGQNTTEEVNRGVAGANYGWPATEGNNPPGVAGVTYPIHTFSSASGAACSIIGGAFYNPTTSLFPAEYTGRYFFGDFCAGFIRYLAPPNYTAATGFATNVPNLVDLAVSETGFLYYAARGQQGTGSNGQVWKVRGPSTCTTPAVTDQPDNATRAPGQSVTFSIVASGTQPLSFQWQRAPSGSSTFTNISGATGTSLTITAATGDNGARYRVVVTNACGNVTSSAATLTVQAAVTTASISAPGTGTTYQAGTTINFAGSGADPAGNPLPASALTWQVDLHHDAHTHPVMPATSGIANGSFVTADRDHTETNVFYRIHLTATSGGQTANTFVDVSPRIVTLQLTTNPAGRALTLDGQPVTAPLTFQSVQGVFRSIGTSTPQTSGGATFDFDRWSDGGDIIHEFRTPTANTTFTAFFTSDSTCVTRAAGQAWVNTAFPAVQTGTFTARFDATPSINNIPGSGHVAFSNGAQTAFTGFANIIRFSSTGSIDARNGGAYAASNNIIYSAGVTYHFRVVVNVASRTYSIFVTPDGGTEQTVGSNFAFRSEQSGVTSLNNWGVFTGAGSGSIQVCNVQIGSSLLGGVACQTTAAGANFQNTAMAAQTGSFTVEYDATPSIANINSTIGLSNGAVSAHTGNAAIVRFNPDGAIDVRNGGAYTAATNVPYSAGQSYHVRLVVNVANRTYSAFVRAPGGAEQTLGTNVAFRSEQSGVTQLNSWSRWVSTSPGTIEVCNFTVSGGGPGPNPGGTPVARNGQLRVCGNRLCNERNNQIQLRGMSTHGLQWYGRGTGGDNCLPDAALDALATDWQADIMRLSLYVQEGGYQTNPTRFTNEVSTLINELTERGLYVIVDWHMLDPGDPNFNLARARTFFTAIATQHASKNNIIYEIANEPNGVSWATIKSYAEQIIPTIRNIDPDAVILVGTRAWSSLGVSDGATADEIFNNPVNATNIMYTFHFYAASHGASYRNELSRAADRIPMFVTEFGTQTFTGDGGNDFTSAQQYLDLMRTKKISWTNWNYSHDFRSGAVFTQGTCPNGPFAGTSRLKAAGAWVRERIRTPADEFPE